MLTTVCTRCHKELPPHAARCPNCHASTNPEAGRRVSSEPEPSWPDDATRISEEPLLAPAEEKSSSLADNQQIDALAEDALAAALAERIVFSVPASDTRDDVIRLADETISLPATDAPGAHQNEGTITVDLWDPTGSRQRAALPEDAPISLLSAALARRLKLPASHEGRPVSYLLLRKSSGQRLPSHATLLSSRVYEGEAMRLVASWERAR